MDARVAVLEQIAKGTRDTLKEIRDDMREIRGDIRRLDGRMEARFTAVDARHDRDFRITFGALITPAVGLAALMAHGFKWL